MLSPVPPDDESWPLDDIPENISRFLRELAATPNAAGWRPIQTYVHR